MALNIYVYAPYSGRNWGQATYCAGGTHTIVWGAKPIDVGGGSDGTPLRFYATSVCRSIRTRQVGNICSNTGLTPWTYGVIVDMYLDLAGTQLIGSVLYGHVKNRVANGLYTSGLWGFQVGQLPPDLCSSNAGCDCATQTCCSEGIHVHMECSGPVVANTFTCSQALSAGSTWIYQFSQ